jgi:oxygen-independent coproporphyrinogen III oxidase
LTQPLVVYSPLMHPYSLYFHIPFCRHRCSYCDFNTYAGIDHLISDYVTALSIEVELLGHSVGERLPVHTIFFGGGTPSLLPAADLARLFQVIQTVFDLQPELEVTLEANPGTLSLAYLQELYKLGVNRISLGMQSANPLELKFLEREHGFEEVARSVEQIRTAGFTNLSLDLIFGLPYQALEAWQESLEKALDLQPDHLSLYALTLEHGTPLQAWVVKGLVEEPDPDIAADMYEYSCQRLEQAGYLQYEISNWGRSQAGEPLACRHNLQYWRSLPYLGFGAGAHGFAAGVRTANVLAPNVYIQRCQNGRQHTFPRTPATAEARQVTAREEMGEVMMMGLRLTREGVPAQVFQERFNTSLEEVYAKEIRRLTGRGLLEWAGEDSRALRLTPRGRLLGNQVFMDFI